MKLKQIVCSVKMAGSHRNAILADFLITRAFSKMGSATSSLAFSIDSAISTRVLATKKFLEI